MTDEDRDDGDRRFTELSEQWDRLWQSARGRPPHLVERELRRHPWGTPGHYPGADLRVALTARLMSDHRWLWHHPVDSLCLAWRHRGDRPPLRTLGSLARPRFVG